MGRIAVRLSVGRQCLRPVLLGNCFRWVTSRRRDHLDPPPQQRVISRTQRESCESEEGMRIVSLCQSVRAHKPMSLRCR